MASFSTQTEKRTQNLIPTATNRKVTTFPQNVEIGLLTFINLSYMTFTLPFRLVYDENKREYCIRNSSLRKTICILRLLLQSVAFVNLTIFNFMIGDAPGPLRVLFGGIYFGGYSTVAIYMYLVLSSNFQKNLVKFMNYFEQEETSFNNSRTNKGLGNVRKDKFFIMGKAMGYYLLCVIIYTIFAVNHTLKNGLENGLENVYTTSLQRGPISEILARFPSLKRTVSCLFLLCQIDQEFIIGTAQVLSILMAKLLEVSGAHFTRSVHDTRKYCVVTNDEIVERFQDLRRAVASANNLCKFLLCSVIITQGIQFTVGIIWTLRAQQNFINLIGTYSTSFCFGVLLQSSAKACSNLASFLPFMSGQPSRRKDAHGSSLKQLIMVYEINSGEIGFGISGVFMPSYSFIGSMTANILSNSAMVLQSLEYIDKFRQQPQS